MARRAEKDRIRYKLDVLVFRSLYIIFSNYVLYLYGRQERNLNLKLQNPESDE